jgi:hypothetical protein
MYDIIKKLLFLVRGTALIWIEDIEIIIIAIKTYQNKIIISHYFLIKDGWYMMNSNFFFLMEKKKFAISWKKLRYLF